MDTTTWTHRSLPSQGYRHGGTGVQAWGRKGGGGGNRGLRGLGEAPEEEEGVRGIAWEGGVGTGMWILVCHVFCLLLTLSLTCLLHASNKLANRNHLATHIDMIQPGTDSHNRSQDLTSASRSTNLLTPVTPDITPPACVIAARHSSHEQYETNHTVVACCLVHHSCASSHACHLPLSWPCHSMYCTGHQSQAADCVGISHLQLAVLLIGV